MVDFSSDVNPLEELLQRQESERQFEERIRQEVARQNEGAQQAGTTSTPTGFRTPEQEGAAQELAQQLGVSKITDVKPPAKPAVEKLAAPTIAAQEDQFLQTADTLLGEAAQAPISRAETVPQVTVPEKLEAPKALPALVADQEAAVTAAQKAAPSLAVGDIEGQISPEAVAAAAQAELDPKATVQFQLEQLYEGFQPGEEPPPWASPAMRRASSIMQGRGLGSSSMAAAAITQSILEAGLPIAQADAQAFATIQLQNLNNQQQAALQNAATFAAMDTANLDARMTAAVENARAFLQIDTQNLNNEQQAATLNAEAHNQFLLSDQAASNAAEQLNTQVQADLDKFFATLGTQVQENNANRVTAIEQFNANATNTIEMFNVKQTDLRDKFNAEMQASISASNAQWRRTITTINNANQMATNEFNAREVNNMTIRDYNNLFQTYRDTAARIFTTAENNEDRATKLLQSQLVAASAGGRSGDGGSGVTGFLNTAASLITAFGGFCWVAQEVYGVENKDWLKFRYWLYYNSPAWVKNLYTRYGQRVAIFIRNKPKVKRILKYFMDRQIKKVTYYD